MILRLELDRFREFVTKRDSHESALARKRRWQTLAATAAAAAAADKAAAAVALMVCGRKSKTRGTSNSRGLLEALRCKKLVALRFQGVCHDFLSTKLRLY